MSEERANAGTLPDDDLDLKDEFDEPEVDELDEGEEGSEAPQEETEETEEPPRRRARPGPRERRERAEIRELREEQQRLRQELAQSRQTYQQPAPRIDPYQAQMAAQREQEQVALLSYDQQLAYWRNKDRQEIAGAFQQQEQRIKDQLDRTSWESMCRSDPLAQGYRDRVEQMAASLAPGAVPRELIFEKLLGEDVRKRRSAALPKQRREAAARVRQQTAAPAGGRSDGGRSRVSTSDDSVEAARRRLAGKPLWS